MYFKNKIIIFLFFVFFSLGILGQKKEILIDKLVAVVEDSIISFSDIEKAILLYPILRRKNESEGDFYNKVLEDLINYRTIFLEYKNEFILNESDYEKIHLQIIEKAGSIQERDKILDSFDMSLEDFRSFITERVFFEKIMREKFQFKISILFSDVKKFYYNEYIKIQKGLNLVPRSLIEMTSEIENYLRQIETRKKIKSWIKDIKKTYNIKILFRF